MTTATPIVRVDAADLSDDEVGEIEAQVVPGNFNEVREFTEAETIVLAEEQGFEVELPTNYQQKPGEIFIRYGKGDASFTGKVRDVIGGGSDLVNLYNRQGEPVPMRRDQIRFYLNKVDREGRIYFARPPIERAAMDIRCPATETRCRKRFYNELQAEEHFRNRHGAEFKRRVEREDLQDRQLQRDMARAQVNLVKMMADSQGVNTTGVVPENMPVAEVPLRSWTAQRIVQWVMGPGKKTDITVEQMKMSPDEMIDTWFGPLWDREQPKPRGRRAQTAGAA